MLGVAAFGVAETFDAPADAQFADGATTPVTPQVPLTLAPGQPSSRALSMSDDGRIVALDTTDDASGSLVAVDRVAGTTISAVPAGGAHPGVSGDGCVVSYSVFGPGRIAVLEAVDLCATPAETLAVGSVQSAGALPAPGVSHDGDVIVWSTGDELLRFNRSAAGTYARDTTFAPTKDAGRFFGPTVDVAGGGTVVAYETLADRAETDPTSTTVHLWQPGASSGAPPTSGRIAGPGARRPSLDAEGGLVAYERSSGAGAWSVEVFRRTVPTGPQVLQSIDASWKPQLSPDGHHLVYQRADGVHVTWWSSGEPFASLSTVRVMDTISTGDDAPTNSGPGPVVSADGATILAVGDQSVAAVDPPLAAGWYLWQHVREATLTAQSPVDLGSVSVGQAARGTVQFTNAGQIGIRLERADAAGTLQRFTPVGSGGVTVTGWSCSTVAVMQPGTSCEAAVSMTPSAAGAASGAVQLQIPADPQSGAAAFGATATVRVTGLAPATSTTTTVPNTTPATTAPASTLPQGTVPTRTVFPLPSDPIFTGGGYNTNGRRTSTGTGSGTSSGSSSSATTTIPEPELPTFEPPTFEFAPTIVEAGRRTTEISLFNPGPEAVTVASLSVAAVGAATTDFVLGTTDCEGISLAAQAGCTIEVVFAPTAVGQLEATLTAAFGDGRQATATLTGTGADAPVLTVEPEVATDGQVVSVFGAGFPAGATVTLSWNDGVVTSEHTVSDIGDISGSFVVLPRTQRGPTELLVEGQPDLFDDVTAELLIDHTTRRGDPVVFGRLAR